MICSKHLVVEYVNVLRFCHPVNEMVTLNKKEQKRLMVLNQVEMGKIAGREAAEVLDISLRHVRRLLAAYRKEGAAALAHGNRGRKPHNALDETLRRQVLELAQSTYAGCNTQHFTELLAEREGVAFSRSSVCRVLLEAGISCEFINALLSLILGAR